MPSTVKEDETRLPGALLRFEALLGFSLWVAGNLFVARMIWWLLKNGHGYGDTIQ